MVTPKMDNQHVFIKRIRNALGHAPDHRRRPPPGLFQDQPSEASRKRLASVSERSVEDRLQLLKRLEEVARPLQIRVSPVADTAEAGSAIIDLLGRVAPEFDERIRVASWRHLLVDRLNLEAALEARDIPLTVTDPPPESLDDASARAFRRNIRDGVARSAVGITTADFCVADTATLVIKAGPGCDRGVSLLPTVHVAVITLDQLIEDLGELYAVLRWDTEGSPGDLPHCLTMITGPSKTGDIEAVMVPGVHGPRELHLFVITGN